MTKIVLRRVGGGLFPADPHSEDVVSKLSLGTDLMADISQPRNLAQLRFIHAVLRKVADNHPTLSTVDAVKKELKIRSKMWRPFISMDGKLFFELQSIAIEKMDQAEFNLVWEQWRRVILSELLPGVRDDEIATEIMRSM